MESIQSEELSVVRKGFRFAAYGFTISVYRRPFIVFKRFFRSC
jgi:hypothetical protein